MEQDKAKHRLAGAVKKLMEKASLDSITVTNIVKEAGVTRQTFYRHFRDKYDLVNWYFDVLAGQCFEQMGVTLSLREGLILKFDFIRREAVFFAQAFKSSDYNSIVQHDYEFILEFYSNIIRKHIRRELDEDIRFLLELYCHGSISMTSDWAVTGMDKSSETLADCFIEALPPKLARLLLPELQQQV
ncbi:MAG: TetR/AcrR family transcriptional regulator C-terminal domain-containing protein [Spirochaetales bacterium]|nr:TetR/AcrR family transcriptional regulator C-terminal domain-containing protein [Spirochaetales bacterium]